jgi:hypothetical protein
MTKDDEDAEDRGAADDQRAHGRMTHEQLRQAITDLATAQVLERRADRSANPALAELLRERALVRRQRAERLHSGGGVARRWT